MSLPVTTCFFGVEKGNEAFICLFGILSSLVTALSFIKNHYIDGIALVFRREREGEREREITEVPK